MKIKLVLEKSQIKAINHTDFEARLDSLLRSHRQRVNYLPCDCVGARNFLPSEYNALYHVAVGLVRDLDTAHKALTQALSSK